MWPTQRLLRIDLLAHLRRGETATSSGLRAGWLIHGMAPGAGIHPTRLT